MQLMATVFEARMNWSSVGLNPLARELLLGANDCSKLMTLQNCLVFGARVPSLSTQSDDLLPFFATLWFIHAQKKLWTWWAIHALGNGDAVRVQLADGGPKVGRHWSEPWAVATITHCSRPAALHWGSFGRQSAFRRIGLLTAGLLRCFLLKKHTQVLHCFTALRTSDSAALRKAAPNRNPMGPWISGINFKPALWTLFGHRWTVARLLTPVGQAANALRFMHGNCMHVILLAQMKSYAHICTYEYECI